ncbi:MAG TPA: DUF3617 family protein [Thermoanaerobaculia bacterium]|nr:DUF3617 family protein [Thermoanaerobaculia bacterium]
MYTPRLGAPPIKVTHCIKADQYKDTQSFADDAQKRNGKCKISDVKHEGDKVSWSYACESGPSGSSEYAFSGTSYEGTNTASVPGSAKHGAMKMTQHIKGKRLGDC